MLTYILDVQLQFCSKVTTTLSDLVVYLNCQGYVQEHPQELQWNLCSPVELQWNSSGTPVELQWNLNRATVQMELKFTSGTPVNPLHAAQWVNYFNEKS